MASSSASSPEISAAPQTTTTHDPFAYKYSSIDDVLEDLSSRFILNLPDEELASVERICFQVEQAHWFYEDFIRENNTQFPSLPLKKFSEMLFRACPLIKHWSVDHEKAFNNFMQYKTRVPVCGAIMLNSTWDKCVLVKGWKASSGWGFPKGKINEDEPPHKCAVREVYEETGYDLATQVVPEDVIVVTIKEQRISLYIVPGVPEDYPFKTRTRKEISKIEWFKLVDLPTWRRNKTVLGKFYLITPFISALRAFINERRPRDVPRKGLKPGHGHAYQDSITQESSSQSSATDPQTPSPQQIESVAAPVNVMNDDQTSLPLAAMDPNLARLLNALSLSAGGPTPPLTSKTGPTADPTPVPASIAESAIPTATSPSQDRPIVMSPPSYPNGVETSASLPPVRQRGIRHGPQPPAALPLSPRYRSTTPGASRAPPTPRSATFSTASASTTSIVSSPSTQTRLAPSRQSSSVATDLSPYLARPVPVPTTAKEFKHMALLESVAGESAKMTPILATRAPVPNMVPSGPIPSRHPGLSASVPPGGAFQNGPAGWSPNFGPMGPSGYTLAGPPANLTPSYPVQDDPFQVRPRSAAYHGSSYPPVNVPRSMHEQQLLSILSNGPGMNMGGPLRPAPSPHMPFMQPAPSEFGYALGNPALPPGRMGPAPYPMRVMPSQAFPIQGDAPMPPSAPPYMIRFNTGAPAPRTPPPAPGNPAQSAAQLLSILNNSGSAYGVLNGPMGPR